MTKLTPALREQILARKGEKTAKGLAEDFGLSQSTINRVFREAAKVDSWRWRPRTSAVSRMMWQISRH